MRYIFPFFIIFFILPCCCLGVTASEIKAIEEATSYKIVVTEVPERGIASFYIELTFDLPCNISHVESDNFLVEYNIVNSTLLIAGAQGDVPGPTGDVTLCIVSFEGKPQFKILKAIVSDVDGNTILNTTSLPSPTLIPTPTPLSNGGDGASHTAPSSFPTPTSTPIVTPTLSSTFVPTLTPTPTPSQTQTLSPTTSPVVTPSSSLGPSPTPTPSQRRIPGFESAFAIAGLFMVACLVLRIKRSKTGVRRKKYIKRRK